MKTITTLIILLISSALFSQDESLPASARELTTKLETWESQKRNDLEKEIVEKRMQVVKALNAHLEKATKSGDLDGALAIRKYISGLNATSGGKSEPTVVAESNPQEMTKGEIPRDAHRYRKSYFKLIVEDEALSQPEAAKKCRELGGRLVSIEAEKKWEEIRGYLSKEDAYGMYIWLGAKRKNSKSPFIWPNGATMDFNKIRDDQLNKDRLNMDNITSVLISKGWKWTYSGETVPIGGGVKAYICEWEK